MSFTQTQGLHVAQVQLVVSLCGAGDKAWRPFYNALLAGALKEAGRTEGAVAVLDEAVALVGAAHGVHEAALHRVAGKLLLC